MYVDEIRSSTKTPFQMKLGECFMLSFRNEGDSLGLYASSGTSTGYIEEKLGVSTKNGEWHTYRIEYYKLDNGAHAKIFVDGNLRADTTVYYGQHGGKEPSHSYGYGRLFATKTCDLTVLYDDIVVEKLDKPYVEETLASPDRIKDFEELDGELYDGIKELFAELCKRGIKPAVATYKREDYAIKLLKHFGFDEYTDIMYGGDHENRLKKKDIIEKCIRTANIEDIGRVVMIGDTESDAIGAEKIGVDFLGVTYGFGFKTIDDIKKVKAVGGVDHATELLNYF